MDPKKREAERRKRLEVILDRGFGQCWLRRAVCAGMVRDCLLDGDGEKYNLHALVIMPNHVHVLVQFFPDVLMGEELEQWKSVTAKLANEILGRSGAFWQEDYWDRYIRNVDHYEDTRRYILMNPVRAGLVQRPSQWRWAWSAGQR